MLNQFLPKSTTEWTYIILIVVLVITLIVFYKGIMKCKTIIESYNSEIRDYKKNLTLSKNFITYVDKNYPDVIYEYLACSDISENDFDCIINEVDKNA